MNIEGAKHYFKHNRNKFKGYAKIKLQSRYITEWVDEKELNWKE